MNESSMYAADHRCRVMRTSSLKVDIGVLSTRRRLPGKLRY